MRTLITSVFAIAVLAASGAASAQRPEDHGPGPGDRHEEVRPPPQRYRVAEYRRPRGYEEHRWGNGEHLPPAYRSRTYYINDYGHYGLQRPPAGHRWVRVNGDAVLVAVSTGIVAASVADIFYH